MMWYNGSNGVWVLMMIVFLALVVGVVTWLVRGRRERPPAPSEPAAQQLLDERFARGEVTDEEYRRRSDLLNPD